MEYCKELHIWVVINFEGNFPAHFLFLAVIKLFVGLVPFDCVRVAAFLSPVLIWISCLLLLGFWPAAGCGVGGKQDQGGSLANPSLPVRFLRQKKDKSVLSEFWIWFTKF